MKKLFLFFSLLLLIGLIPSANAMTLNFTINNTAPLHNVSLKSVINNYPSDSFVTSVGTAMYVYDNDLTDDIYSTYTGNSIWGNRTWGENTLGNFLMMPSVTFVPWNTMSFVTGYYREDIDRCRFSYTLNNITWTQSTEVIDTCKRPSLQWTRDEAATSIFVFAYERASSIYFARVRPSGGDIVIKWSSVLISSTPDYRYYKPSIARVGDGTINGTLVLAYRKQLVNDPKNTGNIEMISSTDNGFTWKYHGLVSENWAENQTDPRIAYDTDLGCLFVQYTNGTGTDTDVSLRYNCTVNWAFPKQWPNQTYIKPIEVYSASSGRNDWSASLDYNNKTNELVSTIMTQDDWPGHNITKVLNINYSVYIAPPPIIIKLNITFPMNNMTYYNRLILNINTTNGTPLYNFNYSINHADNVSFSGNGTFIANQGRNTVAVWAENATNKYFSRVWFNVIFACNGSAMVGDRICAGPTMSDSVRCVQLGKSLFQWDNSNMTLCEYGCIDGRCLSHISSCVDKCRANETVCYDGYSIECRKSSLTGCWDWNETYGTYCPYGCIAGQCLPLLKTCTKGWSKCSDDGKLIIWCDDDNNDGIYEWSEWNKTECEYRCQVDYDMITNFYNASCHYHSYTFPAYLSTRLKWLSTMVSAPFTVSPFLGMIGVMIFGIICSLITAFFGFGKIAVPVFFAVLVFGTFAGFMPWWITFIFIVLGGIILFRSMSGGGA